MSVVRFEFERKARGLSGAGPECVKIRALRAKKDGGEPVATIEIHGYGKTEEAAVIELLSEAVTISGHEFAHETVRKMIEAVPLAVVVRASREALDPEVRDLLVRALGGLL